MDYLYVLFFMAGCGVSLAHNIYMEYIGGKDALEELSKLRHMININTEKIHELRNDFDYGLNILIRLEESMTKLLARKKPGPKPGTKRKKNKNS